jgi:hypothetical protein
MATPLSSAALLLALLTLVAALWHRGTDDGPDEAKRA